MSCEYDHDGCELLRLFNVSVHSREWCKLRCGDSLGAKKNMLKRFGIVIPDCPSGRLFIDWVKDCIKKDLVEYQNVDKAAERKKLKEKREAEQRDLEQIALDLKLPNPIQLARNLRASLKQIKRHEKETGRIFVPAAQRDARLAVCQSEVWVVDGVEKKNCPSGKLVEKNGILRCGGCGCGLDAAPKLAAVVLPEHEEDRVPGKADFEALSCPYGHWDDVDKKFGLSVKG